MNIYNEAGIYIISDDFFKRFPQYSWSDNKNESRPYYYAIRDKDGLLWMIPITSKVVKIQKRIDREESKRGAGNCIFYHIGLIAGQVRGFNIGNMFPVTEKYILHNYTIKNIPYFVKDKKLKDEIRAKANKYLSLVNSHSITPSIDVLSIKKELLSDN